MLRLRAAKAAINPYLLAVLGSTPSSQITTILGLVIAITDLIDQWRKSDMSWLRLAVQVCGVLLARMTNEIGARRSN